MAVLVVSNSATTHGRVRAVLHSLGLEHGGTSHVMCAASLIASRPWSVIVTEADLPDGDWRTVLELAHCCGGPAVVVTSRLADERLWSEVLHLGGYDVLVQPFDDDEIARVLTLARQKMPGFPESSQSSHASLTQVAETCLYDSAA